MIFGSDDKRLVDARTTTAEPKLELPPQRSFLITVVDEAGENREDTQSANQYMVEECGAVSFINYFIYSGQFLPLKIRTVFGVVDVMEVIDGLTKSLTRN